MLFYEDLEEIVFSRSSLFECDKLIIISGYLGPSPIKKLKNLSLNATVVYGMYGSSGIGSRLHNSLVSLSNEVPNVNILYSKIPVHSKCYIWEKKNQIVTALVGSANFSDNGLQTPYREILAEITRDSFRALYKYSNLVIEQSINCKYGEPGLYSNNGISIQDERNYREGICDIPLYVCSSSNREEMVPQFSGLNWGMSKLNGSHVNIDDAYIPINSDFVIHYPTLFPPKQSQPIFDSNIPRIDHRHNDSVEIIWDDGTTMSGLLEGSQKVSIDGITRKYPKQISSVPKKRILGQYLRQRLGIESGRQITIEDLKRYGRTDISISLEEEGIYYFDFSRPNPGKDALTRENNNNYKDGNFMIAESMSGFNKK